MAKEERFVRTLNKRDVFSLSFGAMIGWSWVMIVGDWITTGGTFGAILAFVLGGVMVLFVGLTYSELTSAMPLCGGEHVFSLRALGKGSSFVCTWAIILGYVGVVAFEACAFPTVIRYLFTVPDDQAVTFINSNGVEIINTAPAYLKGYMYTVAGFDVYASWVAVGILSGVAITIINYLGIKPAAILNTIMVFIMFVVGIGFIAAAVVNGDAANMEPLFAADSAGGGIMKVAIMTPFLFVGFDVIPQAAEEINLPYKTVGKILVASVIVATLWYIAIIFCVSRMMDTEAIGSSALVAADAMKLAFGNIDAFANVMIIAGICGILTCFNSFFVGGSRAVFAMAEANMLPKFLAKLHKKHRTPVTSIVFIGVVAIIAPFFGRPAMVWITDAGSFGIVIAYALVALSFLVLRFREKEMLRPYRAPLGTLVGVLAVGMSVFMFIFYLPGMPSALVTQEWIMVGGWTALGVVFGVYAKARYGKQFGEAEGLWYPLKKGETRAA
ncbi:MAG: APC family permease [Clostridiales Family XIII bacterium]|jgi:amino acid transporter|nr:APC family permease [Clostridiales Family XIII bacterium]